jgi:hypothetical protein
VSEDGLDPKQEALAKIEGLTISDVLRFFYDRATPRDKEIAAMVDTDDELETDGAILSEGEDNGAFVLTWSWVDFDGTKFDKEADACPDCGAVEGTPEWGTVGDGFDGYCPSCADKREENGTVEVG